MGAPREGLFALDEIFALRDRDSELAIAGHTTGTAGFTDLLFGVYDVVGLGFSPRIRDLADQRLWRLDDRPPMPPSTRSAEPPRRIRGAGR